LIMMAVLQFLQQVITMNFWAVVLGIPQHVTNMTFWNLNWISCITFTTSKNPTHTCRCYQNCDLWNQIWSFVDSPSSFFELLPGYFVTGLLFTFVTWAFMGFLTASGLLWTGLLQEAWDTLLAF
jgi:hypothetical protein